MVCKEVEAVVEKKEGGGGSDIKRRIGGWVGGWMGGDSDARETRIGQGPSILSLSWSLSLSFELSGLVSSSL